MPNNILSTLSRIHHTRSAPASSLPDVPKTDAEVSDWLTFVAKVALANRDAWSHLRHDRDNDEIRGRVAAQLGAMLRVTAALSPPFPPVRSAPFASSDTLMQSGLAGSISADAGRAAYLLRALDPPARDVMDCAWQMIRRVLVNVARLANEGGVRPVSPLFSGPQLSRDWQMALGVAAP